MSKCKCCEVLSGYVEMRMRYNVAFICEPFVTVYVRSHMRGGGSADFYMTRADADALGLVRHANVVVNAHGIVGVMDEEWMHAMIVANHTNTNTKASSVARKRVLSAVGHVSNVTCE